jgi:dipeptide transport system permease protein
VFTFLLKKLATLVPTLLGVTLVAFMLIRLIPGDPVEIMMGERQLEPAAHAALMAQLGLDQPLPTQYLHYLGGLLQGDLGN